MRFVIVGAGFAGIATAYHLARRGVRDVVVLEREAGPGMHASGRNAGLLRRSSRDPPTAALLHAGSLAARRHLRRLPGALRTSGSIVLGREIGRYVRGPGATLVHASKVLPGLRGRALFDPADAIVDPLALLHLYEENARARGVELAYGEALVDVHRQAGRIVHVETPKRRIATRVLVVAAGAWAGGVASLAGSETVPIEPRRRHLFRGRLVGAQVSDWPFVWDEDTGVYFLPEGDGLLLSPCDETPQPAGVPDHDEGQREILAGRLLGAFGSLGEWSIGPGWPCLRTFTRDQRFVIGPDPTVEGLFWVAALGGHGVTASWAVGRLAARVLLGRTGPGVFAPDRFSSRERRRSPR